MIKIDKNLCVQNNIGIQSLKNISFQEENLENMKKHKSTEIGTMLIQDQNDYKINISQPQSSFQIMICEYDRLFKKLLNIPLIENDEVQID